MKIPAEWLVQRVEEASTSYVSTDARTNLLRTRIYLLNAFIIIQDNDPGR